MGTTGALVIGGVAGFVGVVGYSVLTKSGWSGPRAWAAVLALVVVAGAVAGVIRAALT